MKKSPLLHEIALGWITFPAEETAIKAADHLVRSGWAACAQINGPIRSVYRWKGEVETSHEFRMVLKFPIRHLHPIDQWIQNHHPYENPQWVWVHPNGGSEAYLEWISVAGNNPD